MSSSSETQRRSDAVPCRGGPATPATVVNPTRKDADHLWPVFLPDNRHFLYLRVSRTDPSESGLYLGNITETPADRQSTERLVATPFGGSYVPGLAGHDYVLFARDGTLMACLRSRTKGRRRSGHDAGQRRRVVPGWRVFSASTNTLVYRRGQPEYRIDLARSATAKVARAGRVGWRGPAPDATRVATWRLSRPSRSSHELWLVNLVRNSSTPFATNPEADMPAWSSDGKDLYFALGTRGASLNRKPADGGGPAETLLRSDGRDGVV